MERYESYKGSGVEWIGKIPSHWNKIKVKHLVDGTKYYQIGDGDHGSIKPGMYQEDGIPYIRVQNLSWDGSLHKEGLVYLSEEVHSNNLKSKLIPGDLLVCKTGNTIGKIGVLTEEFGESNTTSSVGKISVDDRKYDRNFVKFSFQSEILQKQIRETGEEKSCQPGFNNNQLTEFFLFSPPLSEQQQIVSFLDTKTSLVDSLIEKTQRKIELLKEKRISLINEVVTKGLNPNVEMRDSGVEWIGEIPSHWEKSCVRYVTREHRQGYYSSDSYTEEGLRVVRITDLNDNRTISIENSPFYQLSDLEKERFMLKSGDFLFPRTGGVGRFGIFNDSTPSIYGSFLIRFRFSDKVVNQYMRYYFDSGIYLNQILSEIHGGVNQNVHVENIKDCKVFYPKKSEQQQIVEYLDEQTQLIDKTISIEEKRIELLKEYRQSLISEVVTGKRKVV